MSSTGAGDVVAFNAVTIGVDGLPLLSYRDNTQSALKVAHCSNGFCIPFVRRR